MYRTWTIDLPRLFAIDSVGRQAVAHMSVHVGARVWNSRRLQLGRLSQLADLELGPVLLEDVFAVILPELLGRVLACHALEDLGAARVLVDEVYSMSTKTQRKWGRLRRKYTKNASEWSGREGFVATDL